MAYGELIDLDNRVPTAPRGAFKPHVPSVTRQRAPVVFGILVGSPISLALWVVIIAGLRSLF